MPAEPPPSFQPDPSDRGLPPILAEVHEDLQHARDLLVEPMVALLKGQDVAAVRHAIDAVETAIHIAADVRELLRERLDGMEWAQLLDDDDAAEEGGD